MDKLILQLYNGLIPVLGNHKQIADVLEVVRPIVQEHLEVHSHNRWGMIKRINERIEAVEHD